LTVSVLRDRSTENSATTWKLLFEGVFQSI
jgi:hypothetical protein